MPTIILSKYFDENVQLVAGMCAKCYQEADVKITAVNRAFLKQAARNRSNNNNSDSASNRNYNKAGPNISKLHEFVLKPKQWIPPRSPHNLIEETLHDNPWSLLVATIFLNKTSCKAARPNFERFIAAYSNPHDVLKTNPSDLEVYFTDLGLHRRRAEQVWKMSQDYVHKNWRHPKELHGIGKYGEDAYRIFVMGDLDVDPTDRFLRIYRDWAKMKLKEGRDYSK